MHQGLSEPEFYGDLVYRFGEVEGGAGFSGRFGGVVVRVGCSVNIIRQSACLVFGPVAVGGFASLFNCTPVGRTSDSMVTPTWGYLF